ncbi:DUF4832 domain-containing protein [Bacteroides sp. 519]|uniref:DUF4832 domain-containing protein n=1 Tax=Bacteroides sp. 519 TaxID=2302937 RepID=UPI0013D84629|nr:DUF4832 domain-containing protein [Bacteroides sp. 519]NDV58715.1 DUF4832 domain-containing protein [Bacteroides sp. 519]
MKLIKLFSIVSIFLALSVQSCSDDKPTQPVWEYPGNGDKDPEEPEQPEPIGPLTSIKAICNPERGYNLESNYFAHNLANPWHNVSFPSLWIPEIETLNNAKDDGITLTQLTFYLSEFVGKDISQEAFDNMQKVFDSARDLGYKIHIVFAYDYDPYATDATFDDVFRHLAQIKPFIEKNIGIVDLWRMGFIGAWGEGNQSPMSNDWENKTKLVKGILDAYPERFMALRYPSHLAKFIDLGLTDEYVARVGYTNDYFTASEHPRAPGNDYTFGSADYLQVEEKSPFVKVVGEIPYNEDTEWGLDFLISVPNSIKALKEHHYSALDVTQNNALNFENWKRYELTPDELKNMKVLFDDAYFRNSEGKLVKRSAYQFVRDHLGYHLYLNAEKTKLEVSGKQLSYNITVYNTGFSTILNPRPVHLVLVDDQGNIAQTITLEDVDPRNWQPYDPQKQDYKQIYHSIKGNTAITVSGKYKVGLWLPDPTEELKDIDIFSIRFANTATVETEKYRINIIGETEF